MADRPAQNEIYLTPSAIEAGASVVRDYREISDDAELASRVYTAMQAALAGASALPESSD
ncbi:MAG: hypothetical protein M3N07_05120 [Pseudomonadota bacterium]|nr:hypothetical protein [Pseudomonadota bacterium]